MGEKQKQQKKVKKNEKQLAREARAKLEMLMIWEERESSRVKRRDLGKPRRQPRKNSSRPVC